MSPESEILPPPNDPRAFESLCLDLWKEIWEDPGAQMNGRKGQPQAGIDVFGRKGKKWVGIQCKQKDGMLRRQVTAEELEAEVQKALKFQPALSEFILVTTGSTDARLQVKARSLTDRHAASHLFTVSVFSWTDLWRELCVRPDLFRRVGTRYWSVLSELSAKHFKRTPDNRHAAASSTANHEEIGQTLHEISLIQMRTRPLPQSKATPRTTALEELQRTLAKIDDIQRQTSSSRNTTGTAPNPSPLFGGLSERDRLHYKHLVTSAVNGCPLGKWKTFAETASLAPPRWRAQWIANLPHFHDIIKRAVWPGKLPELEHALAYLSASFEVLISIFLRHSGTVPGSEWLEGVSFYKEHGNPPSWFENPNYDEDFAAFAKWMKDYKQALITCTKTANWLSDVVRRDLDPDFFLCDGYFAPEPESAAPKFTVQEIGRIRKHLDRE